jgi:hypothetical protein
VIGSNRTGQIAVKAPARWEAAPCRPFPLQELRKEARKEKNKGRSAKKTAALSKKSGTATETEEIDALSL